MATREEVNALYQQYLGRDALKRGLDHWLGTIEQGASLDDVEYNISISPEASVYRTYQQTLGRDPQMEERQAWLIRLTPQGLYNKL